MNTQGTGARWFARIVPGVLLWASLASGPVGVATAQPKPDLLPLFRRLDTLTAELPASTDPTLMHYLRKKSYEKARLFLQGRNAENQVGNCRHD